MFNYLCNIVTIVTVRVLTISIIVINELYFTRMLLSVAITHALCSDLDGSETIRTQNVKVNHLLSLGVLPKC